MLHRQLHNGVHDVVVVVLQRLDSLGAGGACLGHDKLDVLGLDAGLIDLLVVGAGGDGGGRGGRLGLAELLGGLGLLLRGEILDLRLSEDNVGVRGGGLEDVRLSHGASEAKTQK